MYSYIIGNEVQAAAGAHGEERRGWIVTEQQYSPYPTSDGLVSDLDGKIQNAPNILVKLAVIGGAAADSLDSRAASVILQHMKILSIRMY